MLTRKEYMEQSPRYVAGQGPTDIFRQYYGQFVTPGCIAAVRQAFTLEELRRSIDPHLNDIELARWDRVAGGSGRPSGGLIYNPAWAPLAKMKEAGDYYALAGGVC